MTFPIINRFVLESHLPMLPTQHARTIRYTLALCHDKCFNLKFCFQIQRVIRHVDVNYLNENLTDKLRLQIYKLDDVKNPIGKKDVPLTLISNKFSTNAGSLNTSFSNHGNSLSSTMGYNNQQHIGSNLTNGHPNRS
jgi:hypothetical protein